MVPLLAVAVPGLAVRVALVAVAVVPGAVATVVGAAVAAAPCVRAVAVAVVVGAMVAVAPPQAARAIARVRVASHGQRREGRCDPIRAWHPVLRSLAGEVFGRFVGRTRPPIAPATIEDERRGAMVPPCAPAHAACRAENRARVAGSRWCILAASGDTGGAAGASG